MASYKKMAVDKDGNEILSISVESAIYDDKGVRLDNKLNEMNAKYTMSPVVVSSQSVLDNVINNVSSVDRQWYRLAVHVNVENLTLHGGVWYIEGFRHNSGYEWQNASTYYVGGSAKRTRAKMDNTWTGWTNILTSNDLIQSDTVSDASKPVSSAVTKALNDKKLNYSLLTSNQSLDSIGTGVFVGTNFLNAPNTTYWYSVISTDAGHAGTQMLLGISDSNIYMRRKQGGVWQSNWTLYGSDKSIWEITSSSANFTVPNNLRNNVVKINAYSVNISVNMISTIQMNANTYYTLFNIPTEFRYGLGMFDICVIANPSNGSIISYGKVRIGTDGNVDVMSQINAPIGTIVQFMITYTV